MKREYLIPEVTINLVEIEKSFLATTVITLSGSSGENLGNTEYYNDSWSVN